MNILPPCKDSIIDEIHNTREQLAEHKAGLTRDL